MPNLSPSSSKQLRILVVDDNPAQLKLLRMVLGSMNHEVETAENGEIALSVIAQMQGQPFDLVITDREMPVMDGANLIQALNRLALEIKIIWMSGNIRSETFQALAKDLGVKHIIAKPFTASQLAEMIKAAFA